MRKFQLIGGVALSLSILMSSCGTTNDVVSNKRIQKRKYNSGFHLNKKQEVKFQEENVGSELAFEIQGEEKEVVTATKVQKQSSPETTLEHKNVDIETQEVAVEANSKKEARAEVKAFRKEVKALVKENRSIESTVSSSSSTVVKHQAKKDEVRNPNETTDDWAILMLILCILIPPLAVFLITSDIFPTIINLILLLTIIGAVIHAIYHWSQNY